MTFLVTAKMSPELAARVEASVRGQKTQRKRGSLTKRLFRVGVALTIVTLAVTLLRLERQSRNEREALRAALDHDVRAAAVAESDLHTVERVEEWLGRLSGPYDSDVTTDGWRAALSRRAIYVRGDDGLKDALLFCLVDPPSARTEKTLLTKVRASRGSQLEATTPNVRRLYDARAGLPYLTPAFLASVAAAKDASEITNLRHRFEHAPLAPAKQALAAEVLIAAIDEPGTGPGPTELDGERAHDLRLAVVDLRASKVLFRVRRHVDPSWISSELRPHYARGLDSCALAFDLRP